MAHLAPTRLVSAHAHSTSRAAIPPLLSTLLLAWALGGGAEASPVDGSSGLDEAQHAEIERQVTVAVEAFRDAQIALDVDALLDQFWLEFHMLQDGTRTTRAAVSAQIEQTMGSLARLETEWNDLRVEALGEHLALTSYLFSDEIAFASGEVLRLRGETSLVWERRGDVWKMRYADSDHYPLASE